MKDINSIIYDQESRIKNLEVKQKRQTQIYDASLDLKVPGNIYVGDGTKLVSTYDTRYPSQTFFQVSTPSTYTTYPETTQYFYDFSSTSLTSNTSVLSLYFKYYPSAQYNFIRFMNFLNVFNIQHNFKSNAYIYSRLFNSNGSILSTDTSYKYEPTTSNSSRITWSTTTNSSSRTYYGWELFTSFEANNFSSVSNRADGVSTLNYTYSTWGASNRSPNPELRKTMTEGQVVLLIPRNQNADTTKNRVFLGIIKSITSGFTYQYPDSSWMNVDPTYTLDTYSCVIETPFDSGVLNAIVSADSDYIGFRIPTLNYEPWYCSVVG